jgi:opacity protein-like surface antigen
MRMSVLPAGVLCVFGVVANAQEKAPTPIAEVGFNYSYARVNPGGALSSFSQSGGSGYAAYNINRVVGVVADLGAYHNGNINSFQTSNTTFSYLFGPRFNWRMSRITPYVQALVGGARLSSTYDPSSATAPVGSSQNVFAAALGGGVDIALTHNIAVKPIQLEYFMTQAPSSTANLNYAQNNLRYSAGVVFRFGAK